MKRTLIALSLLLIAVPLLADVRGMVVNAEGAPVADATVELFVATPPRHDIAELVAGRELKAAGTARTDAKGNFRIEAKSGNYMLYWSAAGFAPGGIPTTGDEDLGGLLVRHAALKTGRVTAGGKGVANAIVVLARRARLIMRTDEQGHYSVPDPRVWFPSITVIHPKYAMSTLDYGFSDMPVPLDVQLVSGSTLTGRVLGPDRRTGVRAELFIDGIAAGESADDGTYEIHRVPRVWTELAAVRGEMVARAGNSSSRTLQLTRAFSLRGNVVDPATGVAITGAVITVEPTAHDGKPVATAISDARGAFVVPALLPGSYRVSASRAGYSSSSEEIPLNAGTRKTIAMLRLASVTGSVTDDQRRPVGAAFLRAIPRGRNYFPTGPADPQVSAADGRYALRVNPTILTIVDEVDIVAIRKGYANTPDGPHRLAAGDSKTVNITLARGLALNGRVTDADGHPLRDVAVSALETPPNARTFVQPPRSWIDLPTTDAEGRFSLRVRPGLYTIYFHLPGFAPKKVSAISVSAEAQPVEVALERAASITGRVVTAAGEPVIDAYAGAMTEGPPIETRTDATGAFRLDGLPPGIVNVSVATTDGKNPVERQIKAPAEGVTIELLPTVRISGRVLAKGGGAIRDFQVAVSPPRGDGYWSGPDVSVDVHDADGRFVLDDIQVRPAELIVSAPGHVAGRVALQLEKGRNVEGVEVTLERAATIQGRVTDESGAALDRVHVGHQGTGAHIDDATSNANGEYVLDGLPLGETTLGFSRRGYQSMSKTLELAAGETRLDVRLAVGRVLTGQVVDDRGAPVADVLIEAFSENAGGSFSNATTDSAGRFRLEGLGPFLYRVSVSRRGFLAPEPQSIDIGKTSDVTIRLQSGATVTGRITGLDLAQFREVSVSAAAVGRTAQASMDASGRYRLEGAPTGKIGIRAFIRGVTSRMSELVEIETANGGTYEVDIEFREHNTIRGRVTRRGVPVRAGNITFSSVKGIRGWTSGAINANGEYEIAGVRAGENNVIIADWNNAGMNYFTTRTIERSDTVDIDMNPAVVRGRIIDETTGEPIAEADVILERPNAEHAWMKPRGRSGSDGRVLMESVSPGTYDLRISREGYATHLASHTIAEGATLELEIPLKRAAGLVLQLVDSRNGQRIGASIAARTPAGMIAYTGFPRLRGDRSVLVPLAPGSYRIQIEATGLAVIEIAADSPGTREVILHPGGSLEVATSCVTCRARIIGADGVPYRPTTSSTAPDFRIMNGTRITDIAAGSYTLQLLNETGEVANSKPFVIRVGEMTKIEI
jgi:protocatechuate 3,4-dioxygenase beta subunit